MKQKDIDKITSRILELNVDKNKTHEFICALANAKSMLDNKLAAEFSKASLEAGIKSLFNNLQ